MVPSRFRSVFPGWPQPDSIRPRSAPFTRPSRFRSPRIGAGVPVITRFELAVVVLVPLEKVPLIRRCATEPEGSTVGRSNGAFTSGGGAGTRRPTGSGT